MEREPGPFRRDDSPADGVADSATVTDAELEALLDRLPPPPGLPATDTEASAAEARAMQDYRDGRSHPHEVVSQWLATWGKPGRKTFHEWLADRDG